MNVITIREEAARRGEDEYFVGEAHVQPLLSGEDGIELVVIRFSPGARTYLHTHDVVQVLHCIEGTGVLATERERNVVSAGMVVRVPAGERHWHGASADSAFVHLSIRPPGGSWWSKIDPLAPASD